MADVRGGAIIREEESSVGSVCLNAHSFDGFIREYAGRFGANVDTIKRTLKESGLVINYVRYSVGTGYAFSSYIVPAPFLEDEFVEMLTPPEEMKVEGAPAEVKRKVVTEVEKPEWKKLEEIVRDVLIDLGFSARTNERLRSRGRGEIEVDVWADKRISGTKFYVYASCKYWNKDVDRRIIDEEFGRTLQLIDILHLKIFIAKRLTEPAKSTALADGFIVIELGEKASMENPEEIYNIVYSHLKGTLRRNRTSRTPENRQRGKGDLRKA